MSDSKPVVKDQFKGWLHKWTNYIKGYQRRWFVLQNGLLSYYRNQAEMAHTCRGTINLVNAVVHTEDQNNFVISNGASQTFHLKAGSEVERQRWVTALELSKANAIKQYEDEPSPAAGDGDKNELLTSVKEMGSKIEVIETCNGLIKNHGVALQRGLTEIETLENPAKDLPGKIKGINERATLFKITTNAMINASQEYVDLVKLNAVRWRRQLQREREEKVALQSMVEHLAKQHRTLENQARSLAHLPPPTLQKRESVVSSDDEDFEDAPDNFIDEFTVTIPHAPKTLGHTRTPSGISADSFGAHLGHKESDSSETEESDNEATCRVISVRTNNATNDVEVPAAASSTAQTSFASAVDPKNISDGAVKKKRRRSNIPEKPNIGINVWSIMKNCVGRELTKIPIPVNLSEPISFLQRLTEDFEYADCLDAAAHCDGVDQWEQMAHITAFTISSYSGLTSRTSKPFNPLLGETYECDRSDDRGWRCITEQVSHHPPACAAHAEGVTGWKLWQEFSMSSKFRGKYLQIIPTGIAHLIFEKSGNHYTWRKVTTTVHNIIVGKLWVDNHGEMDIHNHRTGDRCHVKFSAYSYFSKDVPRKVTGVISDTNGDVKIVMRGQWDDKMEAARVLSTSMQNGKQVFETGEYKVVWKKRSPPPHLEKCYNFTQLAVELNEDEEGVAPTDSRRRPDQRLMEQTLWDEANKEKIRLEDKQRAARKKREKMAEQTTAEGKTYPEYEPMWFKKTVDKEAGGVIHKYTDQYWKCKKEGNWKNCPDIF